LDKKEKEEYKAVHLDEDLREMEQKGLITIDPNGEIELTEKGKEIAKEIALQVGGCIQDIIKKIREEVG